MATRAVAVSVETETAVKTVVNPAQVFAMAEAKARAQIYLEHEAAKHYPKVKKRLDIAGGDIVIRASVHQVLGGGRRASAAPGCV